MFSDTEDVMGAAGVSKSVVDVVLARAVAAAAAILEAASWLYDLIIVRPLGPTLGVIFLAEGRGGVPVALTVPEFFFSVHHKKVSVCRLYWNKKSIYLTARLTMTTPC